MSQPTQSIDTRGKHRILAELKRLEQETRFVEVFFNFLILIRFLYPYLDLLCFCAQFLDQDFFT